MIKTVDFFFVEFGHLDDLSLQSDSIYNEYQSNGHFDGAKLKLIQFLPFKKMLSGWLAARFMSATCSLSSLCCSLFKFEQTLFLYIYIFSLLCSQIYGA